MPLYQAIVLGIVQGLTEFLPVSSSGHLILVRDLLHWSDPGLAFDVALHAGTLVAVLIYFAGLWIRILRAAFGANVRIDDASGDTSPLSPEELRQQRWLLWLLVLGTVPGAIIGKLFEKQAEETFRQPALVASMMIVVALIMWWAEKAGSYRKSLSQTGVADALTVGIAQAAAIVPGVSRSGSTIAAGLFRGMTRDAAARFSFLLATPIIAGACVLNAIHLRHTGIPADMKQAFIVGTAVSAVVGYITIAGFIRYLRTRTLKIFIVYRIIFGIIVLALVFRGYFG
ncbi:MAG TPA: undecaprenyl-diphosphatase UppP [Terriglobales bacterium]|nr:undecaprenyl-diphosphatase UppP [Terriglobales bacterium]